MSSTDEDAGRMAERVAWEGYESAIERGVPRQLARARYGMTPDAFDQLEEAFIFHWREALGALRHGARSLLTVRCMACGGRHWGELQRSEPRAAERGGYQLHCFYGYRWTLRHGWTTWWWAGKHGDD